MIKICTIATAIITAAILSISAGAYDAAKAIAYAKANVYNSKSGLCAQYVSEAINSGGIDCYSVSCSELVKQLEKSGKGKLVTLVKNSDGSVSYSANKNKISIGDVLFWKCGCDRQKNYVHTALYSGHDSKTDALQVYARNNPKKNQTIYYSCGYCGSNKVTPIAFHFTNTVTTQTIPAPTNVRMTKTGEVNEVSTIKWNTVNAANHYDVEIYNSSRKLVKKYYNLRNTSLNHRFTSSGSYKIYVAAVADKASTKWTYASPITVNISAKTQTLSDLPKGTIQCYTLRNNTTYSNELFSDAALTKPLYGAEVWASDILKVSTVCNKYIKFSYPTSSGSRTAYAKPSLIFSGTTIQRVTPKYNTTVFARSNRANKLGTVFASDTVYMIAQANGRAQILYNIQGGWKLGWTNISALNL